MYVLPECPQYQRAHHLCLQQDLHAHRRALVLKIGQFNPDLLVEGLLLEVDIWNVMDIFEAILKQNKLILIRLN